MNAFEAFAAIISRNTIPLNFKKSDDTPFIKNREPESADVPTLYGSTEATFEVTEGEYQALNIQDHFEFGADGMTSLIGIVAQKSDSRQLKADHSGYTKKLLISFSFLPNIDFQNTSCTLPKNAIIWGVGNKDANRRA